MTLEPYTVERLDSLALRLLDLASTARNLSKIMQTQEIPNLVLNDRKALEWIAKLEAWCEKSEAAAEVAARRARGARRAAELAGETKA